MQSESDDAALADLLANAQRYDLLTHVSALSDRAILLVAGSRDRASPPAEIVVPLEQALRAAGAKRVTAITMDADHLFSNRRVALARTVVEWLDRGCTPIPR